MADRTVKVTLTAQVQGYLQGIDQVQRKTREAGSEVEKLAQKRQAFQTLGAGALAFGAAAALGVGLAVAKYAEFDQAMSNANAILQESTANQRLLKDAALEAGGATVFTATESANAIEELGKAGVRTSDILSGGLTGSLNLAASAQLGVARAAEITGITLKQFNLDGTQAGRVADVLSAGANKAVGSVDDLANGLKFVAPVAKGMNVSLEDTVATLTLFADRGVIGEQAGTSLRGMLSSLTSPSKQAKQALDGLGVSLYDGQGRFKGLENVAGELNKALHGTDDATRDMALGTIFGNQQITAARILVDAGAETWRDYRDAVDDSGIAARIARERMDNLAGDVEKLGGAFDTALIRTGSGANDILRELVQTATFLVDVVGEMPQPALDAGLAIAGIGAAGLITFGVLGTGITKFGEFTQALKTLNISGRAAGLAMGAAAAGIALATAAISAGVQQAASARAFVEALADSYDDLTGAATDASRAVIFDQLQKGGLADKFKKAGVSQKELTAAILDGGDALDLVQKKLVEYGNTPLHSEGDDFWVDEAADALMLQGRLDELVGKRKESNDLWREEKTVVKGGSDAVDDYAESTRYAADMQDQLSEGLSQTAAAFVDARDAYDAVVDKNREWAQSTADATKSADDSWEDYYDGFSVSVADYLEELQRQVDAQNDWEANMSALAGRVSQETLDELARMGPEGAPLVAALVDASDDELTRLESLFAEKSQGAVDGFTAGLTSLQSQIDTFFDKNTGRSLAWGARIVMPDGTRINPGMFADGGFTGIGGKWEPAGIVHKGEFVSTQETLSKPSNRSALEYMHAGGDISNWRAPQSVGVWRQAAPSGYAASGGGAAPVTVVVQSKGGIDLLKYIDVSIETADSSRQQTLGAGRQVR